MYKNIKNPKTGKYVNINSKLGKNVLKNYLLIKEGGGSEDFILEEMEERMKEFTCPISYDLMLEPVVACSGNTYERLSILEHFKDKNTDPLTNRRLANKNLIDNNNIRSAINRFVDNFEKKYDEAQIKRLIDLKEQIDSYKKKVEEIEKDRERLRGNLPWTDESLLRPWRTNSQLLDYMRKEFKSLSMNSEEIKSIFDEMASNNKSSYSDLAKIIWRKYH